MGDKDVTPISDTEKEILEKIKVRVFRDSCMFYFDPKDIELVKDALRRGGFMVGATQTYNR